MPDIKGPSTLKPLGEVKNEFLKVYNAFTQEHAISQTRMAELLGVKLSTLRDTLDSESTSLNTNLVIAFCLKFKVIDIETLFIKDMKEPDELEKQVEELNKQDKTKTNFSIFRHSIDCHELTDRAFMGTFYGYCRNTQYHDIIDNFILRIDYNTHNELQAEIELNTHNQKKEVTKKFLYGKPMHLEPNIIYIVCQSNSGDDIIILSYNYFKINSGKKLYCRYGSLMTPCRSTNRYPQMQAFLLLNKPVLTENMHYIDGFLNLTQDKIIVRADLYDAETDGLMANDNNVKLFFEKCKDMHYNKEEYYCFSEKVLLALGEANSVDYDTTAATIMMLKKNSINPKVVNFPNNKTYSKFFGALTNN